MSTESNKNLLVIHDFIADKADSWEAYYGFLVTIGTIELAAYTKNTDNDNRMIQIFMYVMTMLTFKCQQDFPVSEDYIVFKHQFRNFLENHLTPPETEQYEKAQKQFEKFVEIATGES